MDNGNHQRPIGQTDADCSDENDAVRHLKQAIAGGEHWFIALLQAIGLWTVVEESHNGHHYNYLISGEALDYPLLAERLCHSVDGLIPEKEMSDLLRFNKPPIELAASEFRRLIGDAKYRFCLNYRYGVVVESALLSAVEGEVRKERQALVSYRKGYVLEEAHQRIYGSSRAALLERFKEEKGYHSARSGTPAEEKEFTYWRFKYRLRCCNKEKIASDTQKGLGQLSNQYAAGLAARESSVDESSLVSVIENAGSIWT